VTFTRSTKNKIHFLSPHQQHNIKQREDLSLNIFSPVIKIFEVAVIFHWFKKTLLRSSKFFPNQTLSSFGSYPIPVATLEPLENFPLTSDPTGHKHHFPA